MSDMLTVRRRLQMCPRQIATFVHISSGMYVVSHAPSIFFVGHVLRSPNIAVYISAVNVAEYVLFGSKRHVDE